MGLPGAGIEGQLAGEVLDGAAEVLQPLQQPAAVAISRRKGRVGSDGAIEVLERLGQLAMRLARDAAAIEDAGFRRGIGRRAGEVRLRRGVALEAGKGGGAMEPRHHLLAAERSEGHKSELQSLMRNSYAVLGLKNKHR